MSVLEPGAFRCVKSDDLPSKFLFILEGELVQAGKRFGPGWANVASAGSVDADVYSETGCVFVLVDRA
jgi:hypothetical protein